MASNIYFHQCSSLSFHGHSPRTELLYHVGRGTTEDLNIYIFRKFLTEKPHLNLDSYHIMHWHNYALAIIAGIMSLSWCIPSECHIGQPDSVSKYTVLCQEVSHFCINSTWWFNIQILVKIGAVCSLVLVSQQG